MKCNTNRPSGSFSALCVLAAGSAWGFMGLLVRSLNREGLGSMEICFIRGIVTFAVLGILLLLFNREAFKISLRDIWCFIGTGAVSVAFFNFCYFKAMTLTSLSAAAVLLYTAPAFVMLLSAVLFQEKLSVQKLSALIFAFLGCVLVSGIIGGGEEISAEGILYGLGAGIGYALYSIFGRYAINKNYNSATISFYTFLFCTIATFFFVDKGQIAVTFQGNMGITVKTVILVLITTLFPYLSYTKGLKGMENGAASVLAAIEPVVAAITGLAVYKEWLDGWDIAGICMVLFSIILIHMRKPRKQENEILTD